MEEQAPLKSSSSSNSPDQITDSDHDDSAALELGSDDTGNQKGDDLERSTGTVQEGSVKSTESETLCEFSDSHQRSGRQTINRIRFIGSLMMGPEKLVRTPLGTEEPNMARDNIQALTS